MPAFKNHTGLFGVPRVGNNIPAVRSFMEVDPYFPERNLVISGVTEDETGNPSGGFTVYLINMTTGQIEQTTVSDGSGNYSFIIPKGLSQPQTTTWWAVSYRAGTPDKAGATLNTLVGA